MDPPGFRGSRQLPPHHAFDHLFALCDSLHFVRHSTVPHDRAELSRDPNRWRAIVDCTAAIRTCTDYCNYPSLHRCTLADRAGFCAHRPRLLHGKPTHPELDRRQLPALAARPGDRSVVDVDRARMVRIETP